MANVYLIPSDDATYDVCICEQAPTNDAAFLAREGQYPVELLYLRHDLNMCSEFRDHNIKNRNELLKSLRWLGGCRNTILELWDYDIEKNASDSLIDLFSRCHARKVEIVREEMMEACYG